MRHVLGDWEIATIVSAASGASLSVFTGAIPGLHGGLSGTGYTDNQRPNRAQAFRARQTSDHPEQIINPAAFTLTGFQLGTIGRSRRAARARGPGLFQTDLAFYKNDQVPATACRSSSGSRSSTSSTAQLPGYG